MKFFKTPFPQEILMTPLEVIFKKFEKKVEVKEILSTTNWYKAIRCRTGDKEFGIVFSRTCELAGDCLLFLKEAGVRKVLFAGFAGSINPEIKPGEVCTLYQWAGGKSFSHFFKKDIARKIKKEKIRTFFNSIQNFKKAKVYTIPSLFFEEKLVRIFKEKDFDLLDMETAHVVRAAQNINLKFLYLVTDINPVRCLLSNGVNSLFEKINFEKIIEPCLKLV